MMRARRPALVALAAAPILALAGAVTAPAATAGPVASASTAGAAVSAALTAAAAKAPTPVIVVLRSRVGTAVPDTRTGHARHAAALTAVQAPVVAALTRGHAAKVHAYETFDAVSATVDAATLRALAADPSVAQVVPDATIKGADPTVAAEQAAAAGGAGGRAAVKPLPGVCSTKPSAPQLNPEALQTTHTASDDPSAPTARSLGATGRGVTVAWFAEGIDTSNPDFIRPDGTRVFTDYRDFTGEGTAAPTAAGEAFLDASSIAAQGRQTYDVSHYSALPLSKPCYIRVEGVAPGASMVGLKVFGDSTLAVTSNFLDAIDWAVNHDHVDVLSQSFGSNGVPDTSVDVTRMADEAAVAAGVTVVASSGDAGITNTIGSPASDPAVISAAATTTHRLFLQNGYGGGRFPGVTGYADDNISSLSSGGVTEGGRTVDLAAPGELNWVVCTPDPARYGDCLNLLGQPSPVTQSGGTSESAPLIAGGAALVIQAYRQTHQGQSPSPAVVRQVLVSTADDIGAPGDQQGAGELDTYRAVLAARSLPSIATQPTPQGSTVVTDTGQIDEVAAPGTTVSRTVTVTNLSSSIKTVSVAGRTLGAYRPIKNTSVTLSATSPTQLDWQGYQDPYEVVHFSVPPGVDRLEADIAYQAASTALSARGRLTLLDPRGRLTSYSLPQGIGNYGDVQVAQPTAGQWTGYVYTRPASGGGSLGRYVFGAQVARYTPLGSVSPSQLTLLPGRSAPVQFSTATPSVPGGAVGSLVLTGSGSGVDTTIPVILRSTAPLSAAGTTFTGTLTGGNGRATNTGQSAYYQFTVPQGAPALSASVSLADNPQNPLFISLVDPHGDQVGYGSNVFAPMLGEQPTIGLSGSAHALAPMAGTWTMVVLFAPRVSGTALSQPYSVHLDDAAPQVGGHNLPTDPGKTVKAGDTRTVTVSVHNTTAAPEAYFADPRGTGQTYYELSSETFVPVPPTFTNAWFVPTESSQVEGLLQSQSKQKVQFDMSALLGDPDVQSEAPAGGATVVGAIYQAEPVTQGFWGLGQSGVGPYGKKGEKPTDALARMIARTRTFDRGTTSSTGDLWLLATDVSTPLSPLVLQPGQSGTIKVRIRSTGAKGTVVSGTVFVDDMAAQTPFGEIPNADEVAALPYTFTVG